ncbi:hypothetical protein NDU88_002927 [Pleurodeles waltl]|uniref:Uncharacterized protein n=1 Tax=Pleurodeles waltl TaxID=8319 RepID=A0AAV7TN54_PLEWA|nr:hypothetical protein NDU88_002927 [Pleurodeles waltl]
MVARRRITQGTDAEEGCQSKEKESILTLQEAGDSDLDSSELTERSGVEKSNKIVQALKVLQEEGREDLLQAGVLEQAWAGLKKPKRVSPEGVAAAIMACALPFHKRKKILKKSVGCRKIRVSLERWCNLNEESGVCLPAQVVGGRRGGLKFACRSGASLRQRLIGRAEVPSGRVR